MVDSYTQTGSSSYKQEIDIYLTDALYDPYTFVETEDYTQALLSHVSSTVNNIFFDDVDLIDPKHVRLSFRNAYGSGSAFIEIDTWQNIRGEALSLQRIPITLQAEKVLDVVGKSDGGYGVYYSSDLS
ncbi:MAG: hypothetical protein U9Q15_03895 [Patescibacteria group bacterium]|nr:hypothetical protein [Patescibacteria group bacterium]